MVAEGIRLDTKSQSSPGVSRRELLVTTAITLIFSTTSAWALDVKGSLPWAANAGSPPTPVQPGPWAYFTAEEGVAIEALVDRLIPPDPQTPGGKDAGCAVFIDRQLAGPYGKAEGLYMRGPFADGTPQQGDQSPLTPAVRYRQGSALVIGQANAQVYYSYPEWERLNDSARAMYIAGAYDSVVSVANLNSASASRHYAKCVASSRLTSEQLARNVHTFVSARPQLQKGPV